ncbi:MAG: biotin transporter BioY [Armatimonadetes bacterium]|nr:biotin transporter BioY [Armatimonadota bacterium]
MLRVIAERAQTIRLLHALALAGAVAFFAVCTAAGAQVRIPLPFSPVPVTGQTFFVLLSGALLGRKLGPTSQLLYGGLACVVPGATAGPLHLTTGYIIGFVAAAYVVGAVVGESRSYLRVVGAMALGSLVIYLLGAAWLAGATGNIPKAVLQGMVPFVPGDVLKLLLAAGVVAGGRAAAGRTRGSAPTPPGRGTPPGCARSN